MSCWMITDAHADFLATAYLQFVDDSADPQTIGQAILTENARSCRARYDDRHGMAAEGEAQAAAYVYRRWIGNIAPANLNKNARCAAYQACEHDEWEQSSAFAQIQQMMDATGGGDCAMDDDYPWGIDEHPEDATPKPQRVVEPQFIAITFSNPATLQFLLPLRF